MIKYFYSNVEGKLENSLWKGLWKVVCISLVVVMWEDDSFLANKYVYHAYYIMLL